MDRNGFNSVEKELFNKLNEEDKQYILQSIIDGKYDRQELMYLEDFTMLGCRKGLTAQ